MRRSRASGRLIAQTTLATQLKILEGKGLVTATENGRNLLVPATIDEPAAVAQEVDAFLDNVLHHEPELLEVALETITRRLRKVEGGGKRGKR